jgi:hypothetical protein
MLRRAFLLGLAGAAIACREKTPSALDLEGRPIDPIAGRAGVTVLVFVATTCPISNRYAPELARIAERFAPKGVRFWLVYPGAREDATGIRTHLREHGLRVDALRDPGHALVARAGVKVTPEAVVYTGERLAYAGRIDDRYVDVAVARPEPTRRDLELAIEAALEGRAVEPKRTTAVGCSITSP